jgi:hypothetical protein
MGLSGVFKEMHSTELLVRAVGNALGMPALAFLMSFSINNMQEQNMQEFMSHSKASEFAKLCMRDSCCPPSKGAAGPSSPHPDWQLDGVIPHSLTFLMAGISASHTGSHTDTGASADAMVLDPLARLSPILEHSCFLAGKAHLSCCCLSTVAGCC